LHRSSGWSYNFLMTARDLIEYLGLKPLSFEGGYYRETWRADEAVPPSGLPPRYSAARALGTAIYYLLTDEPGQFSALHRVASDEVFHFYLGDPVEMLLLSPAGNAREIMLGPKILDGQLVQYVVRRGVWQGARLASGGRFALLGATVAPGFDFQDFELGKRDELVRQYPEHAQLIRALTR
jgi:predicted cupin superfamily sugar epimerase